MAACPRCKSPLEAGARFCSRCGTAIAGATDPTQRDMAITPLPAPDPLVGRQIIGQYVIRKKLGEGGMGAVYLADQPSVGRTAVIKVLHPQFSRDPNMAARFEIEARAAARLSNPHIVAIYNYGDMGDGTLFLAMEHLDGKSLDETIREGGRLHPVRAVKIGAQCCDALAEAHRAGIVHRDLKPSNIMLVKRGREADYAKVLDFGIAKLEGVKMTATGAVFGTPQYMSPEQLRGESLDGRSDVYSLGVILYEMLAGQLPFKSTTPAGFMHKHISEPPPPMRSLDPQLEVPAALEAAVQHALAKDPAARPQSAEAFAEEMEAAVGLRSPNAVAAGEVVGAVATLSPVGPGTRRGRALRVRAAWAAGILAVAGGGAATYLMLHRQPAVVVHQQPPDAAVVVQAPPPDAAVVVHAAPLDAAVHVEPHKEKKIAHAKLPVVPPTKPGGTPLPLSGPMPAGAEELLSKSIPDLEGELRHVMGRSRLPPSTLKQVMESYTLNARMVADDQRDQWRRSYLVNLIVAYRKPELRLKPGEDWPLSELKRVYLTMKLKNPVKDEVREKILENALKTYDQDTFKPEDRDWYRRIALVGLINSQAEDPSILERRQ